MLVLPPYPLSPSLTHTHQTHTHTQKRANRLHTLLIWQRTGRSRMPALPTNQGGAECIKSTGNCALRLLPTCSFGQVSEIISWRQLFGAETAVFFPHEPCYLKQPFQSLKWKIMTLLHKLLVLSWLVASGKVVFFLHLILWTVTVNSV